MALYKSNQIKCWFLWRGENQSTRRKTSRSRVENRQTQSTYDAGSGNQTRDTLVEGERDHHCANPAPRSWTKECKSNVHCLFLEGKMLVPVLLFVTYRLGGLHSCKYNRNNNKCILFKNKQG